MNKSRIEAFSDGVIAIIITIMVLELKIPHGGEWTVLWSVVPALVSYILSFVFIGIYWGNHHHLFQAVKQVSSGIIWGNLHLLFWLSLVPLATDWMGENHFSANTVATYAVLLFMCGVAFTILQVTIQKTNPFKPAMLEAFKKVKVKGIVSLFCYAIAVPMAYLDSRISGALFVVVAVMWIVPDRNIEKAIKSVEH